MLGVIYIRGFYLDSSLLASWVAVSIGIVAIIVPVFITLNSRRIKIKGNISSPVIWIGKDDFPCEVELVNHGVRQVFITRVNIEVSARNSWEISVDLKLHQIDRLLLVDGEGFKKTLLLKKELDKLRADYFEDSGFLDRVCPMKVIFGFETSKKQFFKIPLEKNLHTKIVAYVKNPTNKKVNSD